MKSNDMMKQLEVLHSECNKYALEVSHEIGDVFKDIALKKPRFVFPELDFLYLTSWLYGHYRDDAKSRFNLEYLSEMASNLKVDETSSSLKHLDVVYRLRTYLQHSISAGNDNDCKIVFVAESWLKEKAHGVPQSIDQWELCLEAMLADAINSVSNINETLKLIAADEAKSQIANDWISRRERVHSDYDFDNIIREVFFDFGQDAKDVVSFRKRYVDGWRKIIKGKHYKYDFKKEARKLIEDSLAKDDDTPPIDGRDILSILNLTPGPEVKRWRDRAAAIWREERCRREELIRKIVDEYEAGQLINEMGPIEYCGDPRLVDS